MIRWFFKRKENLPIFLAVFTVIGVWFDFAHVQLYFPDDYIGASYIVEWNLSRIWEIFLNGVNDLINSIQRSLL